ncbi:MAG: hypothetical protein K9H14_00480 [Actinomycetia bacterium]|nr:hypothetical protein [Actinomycetes bacterium]
MYLMAIDIGSTSIKAAVYDYYGNLAASGRRKTEVVYKDQDGRHFAFWDPDNIWNCVTGSVKEAVSSIGKPRLIKGIAVTGFACDGVPIDKNGNCLYPFISWHDNRTLEQLEWFSKNADFKQIYKINGQKPWHLNTIFRNLWFKQNRPRLYERIYKWLLIEDFINYKLCGEVATDYSLASTTLMLDQEKLEWSPELFDMFNLDMDIYPHPRPSGTYLGEVGAKAAEQSGLKEGTPVVLGGLDGLMGVYAAAGDQEDNLVGVIGTYEHYHKCMSRPILKEEGLGKSIICQAHIIEGKYGAYGVMVSSGVMEWFKDHLAGSEQLMADKEKQNIWDILMQQAQEAEPGSGGIFMLPDIYGSTCPVQDNYSRGAYLGINSRSSRQDVIRATVEGLNYKALELYKAIAGYSETESDKIIVTGGGTKNSFWMQNKADVFGKVIEVPRIEEATPLGAAMVAGIGVGVYKDFKHAYRQVEREAVRYIPDEEKHKKYDNYFRHVYSKLYRTLKDINNYISKQIR